MLDAIMAQCRNTSLIMGVIALVGLLLQKKSATDVMSGTMKTVIGFYGIQHWFQRDVSLCNHLHGTVQHRFRYRRRYHSGGGRYRALRLRRTEQKWLW